MASPTNVLSRVSRSNGAFRPSIRHLWSVPTCPGLRIRSGWSTLPHLQSPCFVPVRNITLLTTFKVLDNSSLGQRTKKNRAPYLIGFYKGRKTADIGDVIKVAVAGKTNKALIIGTRKTKHHTVPRYDNNCIVLVDDNLAPLGTRIKGPVPTIIRRRQDKYSKVLALASKFI